MPSKNGSLRSATPTFSLHFRVPSYLSYSNKSPNGFASFNLFIASAKKTGFYDTPEAKSLDNLITRNAVTANYIDKTIRAKIPKPTEEEINQAYKQYGAIYKIDSLPYQEAQKALETLVIEAKTQQIYQVLIAQLRYGYSIEKDLSL